MDNKKDLFFNSHATTRSAIVPYTAAAYTAAKIVLSQRSCMTRGCEFMHVTRPRRRRERGHGQRWPMALRVLCNMNKRSAESERMSRPAAALSILKGLWLCELSRWQIPSVHPPGRVGPPEGNAARFAPAALRQRINILQHPACKK